MNPNSKSGRPPKLTPQAAYKFRIFFDQNVTFDKIIDLTPPVVAPVRSEDVDPLLPSSSGHSWSAIIDARIEISIANIAFHPNERLEPLGDDLELVPARKKAKQDNSAPWMAVNNL